MVLVATLAGVRGAVTLVGVLTLPVALLDGRPFPGRETAIFIACGVILLSLIVASALLPLLAKDLNFGVTEVVHDVERTRVRLVEVAASHVASLQHGDGFDVEADIFSEASTRIVAAYRGLHRTSFLELDASALERARKLQHAESDLRLRGLRAARQELLRLRRQRELSDETHAQLMREIDLLEIQLQRPDGH